MRDQFTIGRGFRCILGDRQGQRVFDQIQRVRVPAVDQRTIDREITVAHRLVLHREHAGEVRRAFRKQVRASFRVSRNCNREGRGPVNRAQVAYQRRRSSRLAQVEVHRAAFERGYDRTVCKSQTPAEHRTVQQIHFTPRCDVRVFRTPVTRHHHHVVRVNRRILYLAVAVHLDRAVAHRMNISRHAAAAHSQPTAVQQHRLARQPPVRYHLGAHGRDRCTARNATPGYRLNATDNLRVKRQSAFRYDYSSKPSPNPIGSSPLPVLFPLPIQKRIHRRAAARNMQRSVIYLRPNGYAPGYVQYAILKQCPGCLTAFIHMHMPIAVKSRLFR